MFGGDASVDSLRMVVILVQALALVQCSVDRSIVFEACYNRYACV
jgi:hypothetical protein